MELLRGQVISGEKKPEKCFAETLESESNDFVAELRGGCGWKKILN